MNKITSLEVWWSDSLVGHLALTREGTCAFEYSPGFLAAGTSISPFELPLRNGVFLAAPRPFDGGFGVFDDCLPDGWGLLVLDRYLRKRGVNPHNLTVIDRLSLVGSSGRGALEFRPDNSVQTENSKADFQELAAEAAMILGSDEYNGEGIEEFQRRGGSPGGAIPKFFTRYDNKEWLVKFRAKGDPKNIGEVEYRYSQLARLCGVEMPETRLFDDKYFGVERFDRSHAGRLHVVSVAGLLRADYRISCIDYLHIFKAGIALTHNAAELWKIYRLMVFNYLIGNKDDHAKNFAFIYRDDAWHFAPAFDLVPSHGMNGYHTTTINDNINPARADLLAVAQKAGLDAGEAGKVYDEIRAIVGGTSGAAELFIR